MNNQTPDPVSALRVALAAAAEDLRQGAIAIAPLITTPQGQQSMQALIDLSKGVDNFIYWLDNPDVPPVAPSGDPWQDKAPTQ